MNKLRLLALSIICAISTCVYAQNTIVLKLKDGTSKQFPLENVERIVHSEDLSSDTDMHDDALIVASASAQKTVTLHFRDGSTLQHLVGEIESISQEYDASEDTYTLDDIQYPTPTAVDGMSTTETKWANMNVGAMSVDDPGIRFWFDEEDDIKTILDAVGDGWRLPTTEEVEELFGGKLPDVDGTCWNEYQHFANLDLSDFKKNFWVGDHVVRCVSKTSDATLPIVLFDDMLNHGKDTAMDWEFYFTIYVQLSKEDDTLCVMRLWINHDYDNLRIWYGRWTDYPTRSDYGGMIRLVKD